MNEIVLHLNYFFSHSFYTSIMLFFVLLQYISEPIRWFIYLYHTQKVSFRSLLEIFSLTFLANYILPFKLGIPIRIYLLKKKTNLDYKKITALIASDGLLYYLLWAIMGTISFLYLFSSKLSSYFINYYPYILFFSSMLFIILLSKKNLKKSLVKLSNKYHYIVDIQDFIIKTGYISFILSIIIMIFDICCHLIAHQFLFYMLGIELTTLQVISITSLSMMIGIFSLMPMGLVGYDATMILLLQKAGIGLEVSLFVPVFNRLAAFMISFALGSWSGISMKSNPFSKIKKLAKLKTKE